MSTLCLWLWVDVVLLVYESNACIIFHPVTRRKSISMVHIGVVSVIETLLCYQVGFDLLHKVIQKLGIFGHFGS